MELEWNCKHANDNICQGKVGKVHVGHRPESSEDDHVDDEDVSQDRNHWSYNVQDDKEYGQTRRETEKWFFLSINTNKYFEDFVTQKRVGHGIFLKV